MIHNILISHIFRLNINKLSTVPQNNLTENKKEYISAYLIVLIGLIILILTLLSGGTETIEANDSLPEQQEYISTSDICRAVRELNVNLDNLRRFMGIQKPDALKIQVNQVALFDLYFQSLTLFDKINRLSFEVTRIQEKQLILPEEEILSSHVLDLLNRTQKSLKLIMDDIGIHYTHVKADNIPQKLPSDLFSMIMSTNRQVNLLLEKQFSPSDVYSRVMMAIGYASHLLNQYPDAVRIPETPPYLSEKKPIDVYFSLLSCFDVISDIYRLYDLNTLEINTSEFDSQAITPSDVFDLASLAVARLDFLNKRTGTFNQIREIYYPGRKYPSDVYQYVGILKKQLHLLKQNILNTR